MSSDSFAAFRRHGSTELAKLAEEHLQHDLQQSDRDALNAAASKFGTYAAVGSALGLGLGLLLASRIRGTRKAMFAAFRAREKPTHVQFASGRTEPIPDLTPLLKPTTLGDIATYSFFAAGGLFVFGELGGLAGSYAAARAITQDPESSKRIEAAWRAFRADILRREIADLEGKEQTRWPGFG